MVGGTKVAKSRDHIGEYDTFVSNICWKCSHYHRHVNCTAFSEEFSIPPEIWNGDNDHTKPYPGDNGIQFEPKPPRQVKPRAQIIEPGE